MWPDVLRLASPDLLESAPDGYLVVDRTGRIRLANRQMQRMVGYPRSELIGQKIELLLSEEQRGQHLLDRTDFIAEPRQRPMGDPRARVSARSKDGTLVPVEISLNPIEIAGEQYVFAAVRDISQRLSIEAELDAIRRSLDVIDHGILLIAPDDLTITYANAGAAYQTGLSVTELLEQHTLLDLCVEFSQSRLRQLVAPLVSETVQSLTQMTLFRRRHGDPIPVEMTLSYPKAPDAQPRPIVALIRNISDRIRAERERDRRERLLGSLAAIRQSTLAEVSVEAVLAEAAQAALNQLDAQHVLVVSASSGQLWCRAMASRTSVDLTGIELNRVGILDQSFTNADVILVSDAANDPAAASTRDALEPVGPIGPALFAPLVTSTSIEGVLIVVRMPGELPFSSQEVAVATTLAAEAAITLVLDRAREDRRHLAVVEDRERIARDLHDLVIQRLFAAGMGLQASLSSPSLLSEKASQTITDLDETIAVIRRSIFALTRSDEGVRGELARLIDRHRSIGRNHVHIDLSGDVEMISAAHRSQLIPALNELLSNVERHANAETATVRIAVDPNRLTLTVIDDGDGLPDDGRRGYGLKNLAVRAQMLEGSISLGPGPDGQGTQVTWSVPIEPQSLARSSED